MLLQMHYFVYFGVAGGVLTLSFLFRRKQPLHSISGPPSPSWIFGNLLQLLLPPQYGDFEFAWSKAYGSVYRLKGCFGQDRVMISDPAALQHILNSQSFQLAPVLDNLASWVMGPRNVIVLKGDEHKKLRGGLNPGFSASAVRKCQPVFERVAEMLSDALESSTSVDVDVCPLLGAATFNAITEVVYGCSKDDLAPELVHSFAALGEFTSSLSPVQVLGDAVTAFLPVWIVRLVMQHLPGRALESVRNMKALGEQEGWRLVRESQNSESRLKDQGDLFGLLLERGDSHLTQEDLVAQTTILLLAGNETTRNTLAFALAELAKRTELQNQLRREINMHRGTEPGVYDRMPLLNAFIKETLRIFPAEPLSDRVATEDTVVPLQPSLNTAGMTSIPIRKGQLVTLALASYHRNQARWGADADSFRPERWLDGTVSTAQGNGLGPYANLATFLGGPHTCLGWRFAILEMQVILCELLKKFSFSLPPDHFLRVVRGGTLMPISAQGNHEAILRVQRNS